MAHGEYIMDKVNEALVDSVDIPFTTAKAKALITRCITQHIPHTFLRGRELSPLDILECHFFVKGVWSKVGYLYQTEQPEGSKNAGQVKEHTVYGGLELPKVPGATFADYTALLFKACGWDYHPFIGVKNREEVVTIMEKEGYDW